MQCGLPNTVTHPCDTGNIEDNILKAAYNDGQNDCIKAVIWVKQTDHDKHKGHDNGNEYHQQNPLDGENSIWHKLYGHVDGGASGGRWHIGGKAINEVIEHIIVGLTKKTLFNTVYDPGCSLLTFHKKASHQLDSIKNPTNTGWWNDLMDPAAAAAADSVVYPSFAGSLGGELQKNHRALSEYLMLYILLKQHKDDHQQLTDNEGLSLIQYFADNVGGLPRIPAAAVAAAADVKGRLNALKDTLKTYVDMEEGWRYVIQDMYQNWLWQSTLIHCFNIKFGDIWGEAAATKDAKLADEYTKQNVIAFSFLSHIIFIVKGGILNYTIAKTTDFDDNPISSYNKPQRLYLIIAKWFYNIY